MSDEDITAWHRYSAVAFGKAAHRCHGDGRCTERCVLVGPWVARTAVRGGWFKDEEGEMDEMSVTKEQIDLEVARARKLLPTYEAKDMPIAARMHGALVALADQNAELVALLKRAWEMLDEALEDPDGYPEWSRDASALLTRIGVTS